MTKKPAEDEGVVERVAKAIYDEEVRQAVLAIEALTFDSSAMVEVFKKMSAESFTARIVLLGSFLEQMSADLIRLHMRPAKSRAEDERMFGPNGPLGTFSSRIDLAYSMRWLPEQTRVRLHAIRKIRNLFAHEAYKIDPFDTRVVDLLRNIDIDTAAIVERTNEAIGGAETRFGALSPQQEILVKLLFVTGEMMEALLVGPIARGFRVDPRSILGDWGRAPNKVRNVRRDMARSMFYMLRGRP